MTTAIVFLVFIVALVALLIHVIKEKPSSSWGLMWSLVLLASGLWLLNSLANSVNPTDAKLKFVEQSGSTNVKVEEVKNRSSVIFKVTIDGEEQEGVCFLGEPLDCRLLVPSKPPQ